MNLFNNILMPYNRSFFHLFSVTIPSPFLKNGNFSGLGLQVYQTCSPHCSFENAKKSLDYMPNNSYQQNQNSF